MRAFMITALTIAIVGLNLNSKAGEESAVADEATTVSLQFAAPDVYKTGDRAAWVRPADWNGDGLTDLVCVDNSRNVLYFLYQQEGAERRFRIEKEPAQSVVQSLEVGDFNGDGRADLAMGGPVAHVRYQKEDGKLGAPRRLPESGNRAIVADFNLDGLDDLLLADTEEFVVFLQEEDGLGRPERMRFAWPQPVITAFDANGDERADLIYGNNAAPNTIVVRPVRGAGEFGAETALEIGYSNYVDGAANVGVNGGPAVVVCENGTKAFKVMRFGDSEIDPADEDPPFSSIRALPWSSEESSGRRALELAEIGEDRHALFVLSSDLPAFGWLTFDQQGQASRRSAPALLGARLIRVGDARDGGRRPYWILSEKEKTLGVGMLDPEGATFPQPLDLGADPKAFDLNDMDGSGIEDVALIAEKDDEQVLMILTDPDPQAADEAKRTEYLLKELSDTLEKLRPDHLLAEDLNGDGRTDLTLFGSYGDLHMLLRDESGGFEPTASGSLQQGLFEGVKPDQLAVEDVDGDGRRELLVARSGFVRIVSLNDEGEYQILHQLNGKSADSDIVSVNAADVDGDGSVEILMLDSSSQTVTVCGRLDDGEWGLLRHVDIAPTKPRSLRAADLNGDGKADLAIAADGRIGVMFSGLEDEELRRVAIRPPEEEEGDYRLTVAQQVLPDEPFEIIALENDEHVLEFFRLDGNDDLDLVYRFKVFSGEGGRGGFRQGRGSGPSPREVFTHDMNGDGLHDLILLVHDKVIIYPQTID